MKKAIALFACAFVIINLCTWVVAQNVDYCAEYELKSKWYSGSEIAKINKPEDKLIIRLTIHDSLAVVQYDKFERVDTFEITENRFWPRITTDRHGKHELSWSWLMLSADSTGVTIYNFGGLNRHFSIIPSE